MHDPPHQFAGFSVGWVSEGFAYFAFAGVRDTIIHTLMGISAYFAKNPDDMAYLRAHPEAANTAAEEFFRLAIPLTHIGRVCPAGTDVHGFEVQLQGRISLTWAAANRNPGAFQNPNEVALARRPNPRVAIRGSGRRRAVGRKLLPLRGKVCRRWRFRLARRATAVTLRQVCVCHALSSERSRSCGVAGVGCVPAGNVKAIHSRSPFRAGACSRRP